MRINLQTLIKGPKIPPGDGALQSPFIVGRCVTMESSKQVHENLELDSKFDERPV